MFFHKCIRIRSFLLWRRKDQKKFMKWTKKPGGENFSDVKEMCSTLVEELAKGNELIPSENCSNFDFRRGCLGHIV